ncbi:AzlD domain-containing protein [Yanghanlia caeni]|uniref:AzlD domain-containing protein n=1 Tax=Yanghanlia caeni TaxID=3064283 RepID=A0ABU1D751_9BURK|nr:AzlD domain-containing protein [Alcaligenaceae bacterium LG-2]HZH57748.1 AzlD domain-containing protein [Burkholderiaceae bacterium]
MMHDVPYVLGAIALLTICSLVTRAGYLLLGDYLPLSDGVRRALRYAPAAALVGIIVPEVLPWQPGTAPVFDAKAVAALVGVLLYLRTRNGLVVIGGGMLAYWLLRAVWPF